MSETTSLNQFSTTPADNTNIGNTNIAVGWPPQNVGTAFRKLMAFLAYAVEGTGGTGGGLIPDTWNTLDLVLAGHRIRFGTGTTNAGSATVTFTTFPNACLGGGAWSNINGSSASGIMNLVPASPDSANVFSIDQDGGLTSVPFSYFVFGT